METIHFYKSKMVLQKSSCGLDYNKLKDHTSIEKYVTCKKCKKNIELALIR